MFKRLKLLIKLRYLKARMNLFGRLYNRSRDKESRMYGKYHKASTLYYYANEHINPEETWDMRAEREFQKGNFSE